MEKHGRYGEIVHLKVWELMNCPDSVWSKMSSSNDFSRSVNRDRTPAKKKNRSTVDAFQPAFQMCSVREEGRRNFWVIHA